MTETPQSPARISRRSIAKGAAWAAPVVIASQTSAAYALSSGDRTTPPTSLPEGSICKLYYGNSNSTNYEVHRVYLSLEGDPNAVIPEGTFYTWWVNAPKGSLRPDLSTSSNRFWKLQSSSKGGVLRLRLTITQTGTAKYLGLTCPPVRESNSLPYFVWSGDNPIQAGSTVQIAAMPVNTTPKAEKSIPSDATGTLTYVVASRYPQNINKPGRSPHRYKEKSGSISCFPGIQWSKGLQKSDSDKETCYADTRTCTGPQSSNSDGNYYTNPRC